MTRPVPRWHTYRALWRICLADALAYPARNVVWAGIGALPVVFSIVAWLAVYSHGHHALSMTRAQVVTYYIVAGLAWYIIGGSIHYQLSSSIKDGELASQLLKPYLAILRYILAEQAWKVVTLVLALPMYGVLVWLMRDSIVLSLPWPTLALVLLSALLGALLFICIELCLGMVAFWTTDISNLSSFYDVVMWLGSGTLVPLALFPAGVHAFLVLLPFRYTFSLPLEIGLRTLPTTQIGPGLIGQAIWLGVAMVTVMALWRRGLRRYSAVGM